MMDVPQRALSGDEKLRRDVAAYISDGVARDISSYDTAVSILLFIDVCALQRCSEGSVWQPIETAPKDGTKILAFCPKNHFGKPVVDVTWWRRREDNNGYVGWGEFNSEFWPPTHWMPIQPFPVSRPERCTKCGCETKGEAALVDGVIWCHPCADGPTLSSHHQSPQETTDG